MLTAAGIAKAIDHALLRANLADGEVESGCLVAVRYGVASVCLRPADVMRGRGLLAGSDVLLTTVIGFPMGANTTAVKLRETEDAIADGCQEVDAVLNIGKLLSHDLGYVEQEVGSIVRLCHGGNVSAKIILENYYLSDELKETACRICSAAGADYVKTSTGFAPGGATVSDVRLMVEAAGPGAKVKAAGGIRTLDDVLAFLAAGAHRIGTSNTEAILEEASWRQTRGELRAIHWLNR